MLMLGRRSRILTLSTFTVFVAALPAQGATRVVPPTNCTTSASLANFTPGPITDNGVTVFTTSVPAGADNYVWDVDVDLNITHTNNGNLDITLMSPAGTVVTLTTDNGGTNDNGFAGTLFDDQADPDGQVPYASNDGLVNDSLYTNLVPETPLAPEEALGAFRGEDPAGTWTLTVSDDAAADTGSLVSGSITVTRTAASAVSTAAAGPFSNNTPVVIPATAPPNVVSSTVVVSGMQPRLCGLVLTTGLQHTFPGDIDMTLLSPAGTIVTVTTDNGGSNDNVFDGTEWRDNADPDGQVPYTSNDGLATDSLYAVGVPETPLVPEEAFAAFTGEDPNGTWTLTISDDANADGGTLNSWSLQLTACGCPVPVELQGLSIE